jgi:hypothetical protein
LKAIDKLEESIPSGVLEAFVINVAEDNINQELLVSLIIFDDLHGLESHRQVGSDRYQAVY